MVAISFLVIIGMMNFFGYIYGRLNETPGKLFLRNVGNNIMYVFGIMTNQGENKKKMRMELHTDFLLLVQRSIRNISIVSTDNVIPVALNDGCTYQFLPRYLDISFDSS